MTTPEEVEVDQGPAHRQGERREVASHSQPLPTTSSSSQLSADDPEPVRPSDALGCAPLGTHRARKLRHDLLPARYWPNLSESLSLALAWTLKPALRGGWSSALGCGPPIGHPSATIGRPSAAQREVPANRRRHPGSRCPPSERSTRSGWDCRRFAQPAPWAVPDGLLPLVVVPGMPVVLTKHTSDPAEHPWPPHVIHLQHAVITIIAGATLVNAVKPAACHGQRQSASSLPTVWRGPSPTCAGGDVQGRDKGGICLRPCAGASVAG